MPRTDPIKQLRHAIDRLPADTRRAMLEGVRANAIVVGAYTDNEGGICPMLAAHRHGGRTTHLPFARAWDALGAARKARLASRRELTILISQLEASLQTEEPSDLGAAIAEYQAARAREARRPRPQEIRAARLSPPRRADAAGALARFEAERAQLERV